MTLTEQWKNGELGQGYYYVKGIKKYEGVAIHWMAYPIDATEKRCIEEVLAPVPTYEEWKQLRKFLEEFNALDVAEENQQLKELIKEIRSLWKGTICMPDSQEQVRDILTKIDNAIGAR